MTEPHLLVAPLNHGTHTGYFASMRDSLARILPMAWPVLIGQLAVLGFSTVDTILIARFAANDLAALSVGMAAYISVFIGLMGVVLAISPIAGQLFGAGKLPEAGEQVHQAIWLALGLSVLGAALLLFPGAILDLANPTPEVAQKVRGYLSALSLSLPASLLFTVYRGFNSAVSRPKAVMAIQVTGFTSMAFLISRPSAQAVAGHQLAANLVSLMFMVPLALANGTATLVAQSVGARDFAQARRLGWHGLEIGVALATVLGACVYFGREAVLGVYTDNPAIIAAAMPLLVWVHRQETHAN